MAGTEARRGGAHAGGALERADRVALALEARHYTLRPQAATPRSERALAGKLAGAAAFATALFWRTW
jgi:hypothetical protein